MAKLERLDVRTQMRSPADKVFNIIRSKMYLMPRICPELVKDVKVVKGDWQTVGSVRVWKYVAGMSESGTETIESIDDGNMAITTFNALDGDIAKYYKTFKAVITSTPNGQGSLPKWTLVYEKQNQNIADPDHYADSSLLSTQLLMLTFSSNKKKKLIYLT